jgi:hypothetical protein
MQCAPEVHDQIIKRFPEIESFLNSTRVTEKGAQQAAAFGRDIEMVEKPLLIDQVFAL